MRTDALGGRDALRRARPDRDARVDGQRDGLGDVHAAGRTAAHVPGVAVGHAPGRRVHLHRTGPRFSYILGRSQTRWFRILDTQRGSAPPTTSNARTATFTVSSVLGTLVLLRPRRPLHQDLRDQARRRHRHRDAAGSRRRLLHVCGSTRWTARTPTTSPSPAPGPSTRSRPASRSPRAPTAGFDSRPTSPRRCRERQLDGVEFASCASGHQPSVGPGEHRLAVRAVDRVGRGDRRPRTVGRGPGPVPAPRVLEPARPRGSPRRSPPSRAGARSPSSGRSRSRR